MTKTAKLPQKKKPEEIKHRPNAKHLPKAKPKIEVKATELPPIKQHVKAEEQLTEKVEPAIAKLGSRRRTAPVGEVVAKATPKKKEDPKPEAPKAVTKLDKVITTMKHAVVASGKAAASDKCAPENQPEVKETSAGASLGKRSSPPEARVAPAPSIQRAKSDTLHIDDVLGTINTQRAQAQAAATFDVSQYLVK